MSSFISLFFSFCVRMNTFHAKFNPSRTEDGQCDNQKRNRIEAICIEGLEKRKRTQERYR